MSDDRWYVDTESPILDYKNCFFDAIFWYLPKKHYVPLQDFIIELVAEIEQLQTENIKLQDTCFSALQREELKRYIENLKQTINAQSYALRKDTHER